MLTIGGGAGRHVMLQSPEQSASDIELLNAGGQEGGYPASQMVDTATATRAASSFYLYGAKAGDLIWAAQE
jgi:hypothetical protein